MSLSLHLVSDLDGTWIPSEGMEEGLRQLEAFLGANSGIVLTFATGRSLASARQVLASRVKVWPSHFITDVGTAIHHRQLDGVWAEDKEYAAWVESRWDGPGFESMGEAWIPEGVERQPDVIAHRRLAFHVAPWRDVAESAEELRASLARMSLAAEVLATGQCLDVLPVGVDKGAAAVFLHSHLGVPRPLVVCGDSENDIGMFKVADLPILMADSPLTCDSSRVLWDRLHRPHSPGPMGILETLLSLAQGKDGRR